MNANNNEQMVVSAIKNGTVIDKIPPQHLFQVIEILGLNNIDKPMTFGNNLSSQKLGKKGIIKVADYFFDDNDINRIALLAPEARLNIIKDYKVVEKRNVVIPEEICGVIRCFNPKCITNHQQIETKFHTIEDGVGVAFRCHYCEKVTTRSNLTILGKK